MSDSSKIFFKLVEIRPVGFKMINYPDKYCGLCRGLLVELCNSCLDNNLNDLSKCCVKKKEDHYFHEHCLKLLDGKNT